ncbi:hypothetical protein AAMO2058_001058900 [Amorphochlora amoebiformis]
MTEGHTRQSELTTTQRLQEKFEMRSWVVDVVCIIGIVFLGFLYHHPQASETLVQLISISEPDSHALVITYETDVTKPKPEKIRAKFEKILPKSERGFLHGEKSVNYSRNISAKLVVAINLVGHVSYFLDPTIRESMETHLLKAMRRISDVHTFLCVDTSETTYLPKKELKRLNITVFTKSFPGRMQFYRKKWCHNKVEEYASNNSISFDWVVQTRPDLMYFADVPDISKLGKDRIYGRLRASGFQYSKRWNLSSLAFSHAFSHPSEIACWGKFASWQKDCIIADDQFNYIPWPFARAMNLQGKEWSGFRGRSIPVGDNRTVRGFNVSYGQLNTSTGYIMCKAAFPGESYFTRMMTVGKFAFQPLHINICLGKNVYHPRRRRSDCQFHARTDEVMRIWQTAPDCRNPKNWEEWDNIVNLCNKTSPNFKANAGC